jgi:Na+/melibiose symporter-like transporter
MAFFMIFTIVSFLGIIALLWCFRGFSGEASRERHRRAQVRVESFRLGQKPYRWLKWRSRRDCLIALEQHRLEEHKPDATAKDEPSLPHLKAASVITMAILLGSR